MQWRCVLAVPGPDHAGVLPSATANGDTPRHEISLFSEPWAPSFNYEIWGSAPDGTLAESERRRLESGAVQLNGREESCKKQQTVVTENWRCS